MRYDYNENGEIAAIRANINGIEQNIINDASYLPFGGVTGFTYANGLRYQATYDQSYRLVGQTLENSALQNSIYRYNRVDQLLSIADSADQKLSQQFSYS